MLRNRLGLIRSGMEAAAKAHIEASGWMRDHLTKAVGLHVADEVWETIDRHLFPDASGRRHGPPRVGSWWEFTRIPGRARSHTKISPVWETWRLAGSLDGHLASYRHPQLPGSVSTAAAAATQPGGTSILAQPARLAAPAKPPGSWWDHGGALAVVFTGLAGGDVVVPVRLPQGAGQWAHLCHFLADPNIWHKIDLVRVRDRRAPGGWRYYAHLLVHQAGYQSPATQARRAEIPGPRRAGIDANVSNLSVASFPDRHPDQLALEQVTVTDEQNDCGRACGAAGPGPAARVGSVAAQQQPRPVRIVAAPARPGCPACGQRGLPAKQVGSPGGARRARADGTPLRAYRHDDLSESYQRDAGRSRRRRPGAQPGKRPAPRDSRARRGRPRQHHHHRGLHRLERGPGYGASESSCSARAC